MAATVPLDSRLNGRSAALPSASIAPASVLSGIGHSPKAMAWRSLRAELDAEDNLAPSGSMLAIPELASFDQNELNDNPVLNQHQPVSLVGALLISEGLITREQLNACMLLQAQDHPDLPIGQILVRCGYIPQQALDQALGVQADMKSSLVNTIEAQDQPVANLTAVVLHARAGELAYAALNQLGVAATPVRDWAEFKRVSKETQFDMALIGDDLISDSALLPDQSIPMLLLPRSIFETSGGFFLSQSARAIVARFVVQVRTQRRQRDVLEHLHQRDFELSAIAALGRSICTAHSAHDAVMRLMLTIRDLFGVEAGTLYRFDRSSQQLIFEVVIGPHQETLYQRHLPIDRGLAGWVVRHGEPLLIPDVRRDMRFEGMFDHQNGFQTRSVLCVPLIARGEVCGVVQLINKLNGEFNERDLLLLRILAAMGALAAKPDVGALQDILT